MYSLVRSSITVLGGIYRLRMASRSEADIDHGISHVSTPGTVFFTHRFETGGFLPWNVMG
jgi:hypothetical protein